MKKVVKKKITSLGRARVRSDHALAGNWENTEKSMHVLVGYNHPLVGAWQEVENSVFGDLRGLQDYCGRRALRREWNYSEPLG